MGFADSRGDETRGSLQKKGLLRQNAGRSTSVKHGKILPRAPRLGAHERRTAMKLAYEHAHILHTNHDEAVRFYREILGARVVDSRERKGAPQTKLMAGGGMLIVRGVRPGENPDPPGRTPRLGVDHIGFYVGEGELETTRAMLLERGVPIVEEDDMPHLKYLYFQGPDGVVIELMETKAPLPASVQEHDEES